MDNRDIEIGGSWNSINNADKMISRNRNMNMRHDLKQRSHFLKNHNGRDAMEAFKDLDDEEFGGPLDYTFMYGDPENNFDYETRSDAYDINGIQENRVKKINENTLRKIIRESIYNVLNEGLNE